MAAFALLALRRLRLLISRQLFHFAPQLFGLTPQHLLLPALLVGLLAVALLLGKLLLPARQFLELLKRFLDLFLPLFLRDVLPAGLVLVFLAVQLQVNQALNIARASTAPALVAESHLDLSKRGFSPLQVLQCLLLRR